MPDMDKYIVVCIKENKFWTDKKWASGPFKYSGNGLKVGDVLRYDSGWIKELN